MITTSSSAICDTFVYYDFIFVCCLTGVASCLSETNQTTSQTGGLNRKGVNIATHPASCVTPKPPSKRQLGASTPKDTKNILLNPWFPVTKDVKNHQQNPKSDLLPPSSKAAVMIIYLTSTFNAFQSLGNTTVSNAIPKPTEANTSSVRAAVKPLCPSPRPGEFTQSTCIQISSFSPLPFCFLVLAGWEFPNSSA